MRSIGPICSIDSPRTIDPRREYSMLALRLGVSEVPGGLIYTCPYSGSLDNLGIEVDARTDMLLLWSMGL